MPELRDAASLVAEDLSLPQAAVLAVAKMLDEGNTVPFIARYRKEATGNLDEVQIRAIEERRAYLRELNERRTAILKSIEEQGKLTDALRKQIDGATTKTALEDLYLPYKKKRKTRASMARERGLEPLANRLLEQPGSGDPAQEAQGFVDAEKGVDDADAALAGARDIVAELAAEHGSVRSGVRKLLTEEGVVSSAVVAEKKEEPTRFEQYYDFSERIKTIPSHRFLAIRRGEREGVLRVRVEVDEAAAHRVLHREFPPQGGSPFRAQLEEALADSWKRLLHPSLETEIRVDLKTRSDTEAVEVFASNLRDLLLAAPLGGRSVVGIDPGLRTGCKCVALDDTGRFLEHVTIYPVRDPSRAQAELAAFLGRHNPFAVAVGNGTGGRETETLVRTTLKNSGAKDVVVISVNEAGASVYSASDVAREEFPELDLTVRGAISIGRRLQDPLAELVKIDPKAIGVGQYQHDVHQPMLQRKLGEVVETCVNRVGVELNTASAPLLSAVAGVGPKLAHKIVEQREQAGRFNSRKDLLKVSGLGPKAFEQCAGFLRIRDGAHPLDASAVHPERYKLVEQIGKDLGIEVNGLVGNESMARRIDVGRYVGDGIGELTLNDIVDELQKPGRDPRETFEPPQFRDDVQKLSDLKIGMQLEGVVTNVTHFGAFVDVGVHQDGLVHISQLSDRYVEDPRDVVKVGDKLKVRVMEVDAARNRIALTAKSERPVPNAQTAERGGGRSDGRGGARGGRTGGRSNGRGGKPSGRTSKPPEKKVEGHNNPLGDLLKDFRPKE